jgi:hypothetical protein
MYCVHWLETGARFFPEQIATWKELTGEDLDPTEQVSTPKFRLFGSDELTQALKFCEELRARRRDHGHKLSFIGMQSEDPNSVGEQGVKAFDGFQADGVTPYDWKKRRI